LSVIHIEKFIKMKLLISSNMKRINYIQKARKVGDTTHYLIGTNAERVEAVVSPNGSCLKIAGQPLDKDLAGIILDELQTTEDPKLLDRANEILSALGRPQIAIVTPAIPLTAADSLYTRVRHYTTPSRAERIAKERILGGPNAPRKLDQGKVFLEPADWKVLSQQEFVDRYAITDRDLGKAYVEFLVQRDKILKQTNPRNGLQECYILADQTINAERAYRIPSEVKVFKR
jgi:hypothetical protein